MGIPIQVLKILLEEHAVRPITGTFASIGVQTVHISKSKILDYARNLTSNQDWLSDSDASTRHSSDSILDSSLIEGLFNVEYLTIDRSNYEGATTILDLNEPIPREFHNSLDFLYSGGSLDNVFDPRTVLENCGKLLKPGGRFLSYDACQGVIGAYLHLTPEWLYSWFSANNWKDCQVYVLHQESPGESRFVYSTNRYTWTPHFTRDPNFNHFDAALSNVGIQYVSCIAEKDSNSTTHKVPVQLQYLDQRSEDWTVNEKRYELSARKIQPKNVDTTAKLIFGSSHYSFIEGDF